MRWEHFAHSADIGIRGIGATPDEAFAMAGLALTAVVTPPATVRAQTEVRVRCSAPELDLLFLDWINAIIYEMDTRRMVFSEFHVQIEGEALQARLVGESLNRDRHELAVEVKGGTLTELRVQKLNADWIAQCVVDV